MQATNHRPSFSPWLAVIAGAVAFFIYFGVINSELLLEGRRLTTENPQIQPTAPIVNLFTKPTPDLNVKAGVPVYRPALATMLRVERSVWNRSQSSFHSMNLILLIALLLMIQAWSGRLTKSVGATACVVITFAAHPMLNESVRTIEGQGLLLALITMIGSMGVLNMWRAGRIGVATAAALIAIGSAVAFGSHEIGLVLPVWLAAQWALTKPDPAPIAGGRKKKNASVEPQVFRPVQIAFVFGPVALVAIGYGALRWFALGSLLPAPIGGGALPFGSAAALAIQRVLWPVHPTLVYSVNHDASFLPPEWRGFVMLAIIALLAVVLIKRKPLASLGLVLALSAALAIAGAAPLSRTFSEAPLAAILPGACLAIGAALQPVYRRRFAPALAIAWLPLIAIGFMTGSHWHNADTLWEAEAKLHPGNPYPLLQQLEENALDPDKSLWLAARVKPMLKRVEDKDRVVQAQAMSYSLANRISDLDKLLGDEIAAGGDHTPNHMLRLAQAARIKGLEDRANGLLRAEYDRNPKSFGALYGLAEVERKKGALAHAIRMIQGAIENAPDAKARGAALARYGAIIAEGGALEGAEVQLNLALAADNQQYEAYLYLARVLRDQKKYKEAVSVLNRCLQNMNLESQVDVARIMTSILAADKNPNLAAQWLIKTASENPRDIELNLFAAHYMVEVHRFRDASEFVKRLYPLAQGKQQVELWNISAFIAFAAGDYNAAEGLTRRVLKADPAHREASQLLPEIMAARNRADKK